MLITIIASIRINKTNNNNNNGISPLLLPNYKKDYSKLVKVPILDWEKMHVTISSNKSIQIR